MNRKEVTQYLASLSEGEFARVVYESARGRRKEARFDNGDFEFSDAYSIAVCSFGAYEGKKDAEAIVELFAPPACSDHKGEVGLLVEQGVCSFCGVSLKSFAKIVRCPVCGTEAELT